jgi:hypothetical protein
MKAVVSSTADGLRTVAGTGQPSYRGQIHRDERQGVPHLAVRVRDGAGLVGPLVIPGMFSTVLVSGLDRLGAAKMASQTSRAMTALWADCGHGVGTKRYLSTTT